MPKKKRKKKWVVSGALALLLLSLIAFFVIKADSGKNPASLPAVTVKRGTIEVKALAVGTIEPENEISIKSRVSGVVGKLYVDVGSYVHEGDPLIQVKPDPTPVELADAKRQVELAQVDFDNIKAQERRQRLLYRRSLLSPQDYDNTVMAYREAELHLKMAQESLQLMVSGSVTIDHTRIRSIIYAPITGYILTRSVEVGDPVIPLTSYQEGTVLMQMANMSRLVFKGTVDEIDVGSLKVGMPAEISIGALPGDTISGTLTKIWLQGETRENSAVFPVEISILNTKQITLRAGYSANASIITQKKTDVLYIPERVVTFRNDSSFVRVPSDRNKPVELAIRTGISDAISIEVTSGLALGEKVLEKPVVKIQ